MNQVAAKNYQLSVLGDGQLSLSGDVNDADILTLRSEGEARIAAARGKLIVDLSGFNCFRSVMLSTLLCWQRAAIRHRVDLHFRGIAPRMYDIARVSGLDDVLRFNGDARDSH